MEVAIGLGREAGLDTSIILPLAKVSLDDLLDEVETLLLFPSFHEGLYAMRHI
jgi:hypothetical protein